MKHEAVRVATANNFNCTSKEWEQLQSFEAQYPEKAFFINSNIKTPLLSRINYHNNKAVITLNPDLTPNPKWEDRLKQLNPNRIAFVRIKWLPNRADIVKLVTSTLSKGYKVILTLQRWNSWETLAAYTDPKHYAFDCSRARLNGPALAAVETFVDSLNKSGKPVWICDRKGLGCQGCGLCARLTSGSPVPVKELNLSSSGLCPYNCPDCYAKTAQERSVAWNNSPIKYDTIKANSKQAGRTEHIKRARKEAKSGS